MRALPLPSPFPSTLFTSSGADPCQLSTMAMRHSCAKLELAVEDPKEETGSIFVKATWHPTKFSLAVTDGQDAWICHASDGEVKLRAEQWDQPVSEYLALVERYLSLQQPGSNYSFEDAGNVQRRVCNFL